MMSFDRTVKRKFDSLTPQFNAAKLKFALFYLHGSAQP